MVTEFVPTAFKDVYNSYFNWPSSESKTLAIRVTVAVAICFSFYQGYPLAAALAATFSLPATTLAAGTLCLTYGYATLKAGVVAKNIFNIAFGAALLYNSWQLLNQYKNFQGIGESGHPSLIQKIANSTI
jgi:hypothetical protein